MKTFLVTGADRGIGEALCLELQARGERVIAACLGDSPTLRSRGVRVEQGIDVTSDTAVAALAADCHARYTRWPNCGGHPQHRNGYAPGGSVEGPG